MKPGLHRALDERVGARPWHPRPLLCRFMRVRRALKQCAVAAAAAVLLPACGGTPAGTVKPPRPADGSLTGRVGVVVATNSPSLRAHVRGAADQGVIVLFVQPDGPAARAGIRIGDVITNIDETPSTNSELAVVLLRAKPNDTRRLEVVRAGGARETVRVTARLPGRVDLRSLYGPLIVDRPDDPVLRFLRASATDPIGGFSRAIADLNRALDVDSRFVEALSLRAEVRWQASRLTTTARAKRTEYARAALLDWDAAAKIDNRNTRTLVGVAQAFNQVNQTDRARRVAEAALRVDDRIPAGYYALGYARWASGKNVEAAEPARKAIGLNPFDVRYYELLGSVFRRLDRADDCRTTINSIVRLLPNSSERQSLLKICG